ncbi:MAG: class I SAM-dependent methyltransferase [Acidimicrobiales bacterium]
MIEELPAVEIPGHRASGLGSDDHPMRIMTRRAAGLIPGGWDAEARGRVEVLFDELSSEWHTRTSPQRTAVVTDALDRGGVTGGRVAIEVGSGIGNYSSLLAERFRTVAAIDLSLAMLRLAPRAAATRIQADAADLPFRAGCADAVVLVNALLFPAEVDRVLAPDGALAWVNTSGEQTPIHLRSDEVAGVLPGEWRGVASRAGLGSWCVLRRA